MKILFLIFCIGLILNSDPQQRQEFVCLPCGYECDKELHTSPGICPSCHMNLVEKSTINFTDLSVSEFCNRIISNPKAVLLDVRTPGEFRGNTKEVETFGHFKNAINVNAADLEQRLGELSQYKDVEVLVYCSHNHRSPAASYFLSTHGFKHVKNMTGGVSTLVGKQENDCLKKSFVFHTY